MSSNKSARHKYGPICIIFKVTPENVNEKISILIPDIIEQTFGIEFIVRDSEVYIIKHLNYGIFDETFLSDNISNKTRNKPVMST